MKSGGKDNAKNRKNNPFYMIFFIQIPLCLELLVLLKSLFFLTE